jgi:sugar phosphate isomerase/epimerase
MNLSRRDFLINSAIAGSIIPSLAEETFARSPAAGDLKVNIFSKHLQFLNYQDMAEAAKELGFDGIDLTVRPKGHVLPEKVETDLPLAVEAMKKVGMTPQMFCTAVEDAANPVDKKLLETAAKLGFKYYRMNWYRYNEQKAIPEQLGEFGTKMAGLSQLNEKLGIYGCYQNHSGRHATVEGGLSWQTGFNLIQPHIKTIVIKDFYWEKNNAGKWAVKSVPLGEGMVDFKTYFKLLKDLKVDVPICLHLEYPLGGADQGAFQITVDKKVVFDAMKRDLARLKELWAAA